MGFERLVVEAAPREREDSFHTLGSFEQSRFGFINPLSYEPEFEIDASEDMMAELSMSDPTTEEPTTEQRITCASTTATDTGLDPYFDELPQVADLLYDDVLSDSFDSASTASHPAPTATTLDISCNRFNPEPRAAPMAELSGMLSTVSQENPISDSDRRRRVAYYFPNILSAGVCLDQRDRLPYELSEPHSGETSTDELNDATDFSQPGLALDDGLYLPCEVPTCLRKRKPMYIDRCGLLMRNRLVWAARHDCQVAIRPTKGLPMGLDKPVAVADLLKRDDSDSFHILGSVEQGKFLSIKPLSDEPEFNIDSSGDVMAELLMSDPTTEEPTVEGPATDLPSTETSTGLHPNFGELPEVADPIVVKYELGLVAEEVITQCDLEA